MDKTGYASPRHYRGSHHRRRPNTGVSLCALLLALALIAIAVFSVWGADGLSLLRGTSGDAPGAASGVSPPLASASVAGDPSAQDQAQAGQAQTASLDLSVLPDVQSSNIYLVALDSSHDVLLDQAGDERIYPASLTKVMTALVVLEYANDLNAEVVLDQKIFDALAGTDSSVAGFVAGERVCVLDLLYGLLLPSGGECALGLADYIAGSEGAFTELMNEKARQLGLTGTHFSNVTGLHAADTFSTAHDIATLTEYGLRDETFSQIFTTASYRTAATNKHSNGMVLTSTLFSHLDDAGFEGGALLGGKTGYTDEAGYCLVSLAEKDGMRFLLVTCGGRGLIQDHRDGTSPGVQGGRALGGATQSQPHIADAFTLYAAISVSTEG